MGWTIDIIVLIVSWAIVGQHIWATRGHFVSEGMATGAAILAGIVIASTVIYSALMLLLPQPPVAALVGIIVELASLLLFWAAIAASRQAALHFAFDPNPPHSILNRGPYRVLRHPFYTSYIMFWAGWAIAAWSLLGLLPLVCLVAFYIVAAKGEERKFAATGLGADYERYKQETGFFWPKLAVGDRR